MRFESWKNPTLFAAAAMMALTVSAHATPGPADDRINNAPVPSWKAVHSVTPATLQHTLDTENVRITDLSIEQTDPLLVSAVLVRNEASFAVANSFFFHGMQLGTAEATFNGNGKRPIVLRTYVVDGAILIAGTSVPNTGANHRVFHIRTGTASQVSAKVSADKANDFRPLTVGTFLDPDSGDRQFAVIDVARNGEAIDGTLALGISRAALQPTGSSCKDLIDVAPDHNTAMQQNAIFYTGIPRIGGVCAHLVDFDTDFGELFDRRVGRMLFFAHYVLHGSGSSDGETEFVTSEVWNF